MKVYTWKVVDGTLGVGTLNKKSELEDFRAAILQPGQGPQTPNLIDILRSGVEYGPLGTALARLAGATLLEELHLEGIPPTEIQLPDKVGPSPIVVPDMEFAVERRVLSECVTPERLRAFCDTMRSEQFVHEFFGEDQDELFEFTELGEDQLPLEIELVIAKSRTYRFEGNTFKFDAAPVVVGLHERSVAEAEAQLGAKFDNSDSAIRNRQRRRARWHLSRSVEGIISTVETALKETDKLQQVVGWLATDGAERFTPRFLTDETTALRSLYQGERVDDFSDFVPLYRHLVAKLRELTLAHVLDHQQFDEFHFL